VVNCRQKTRSRFSVRKKGAIVLFLPVTDQILSLGFPWQIPDIQKCQKRTNILRFFLEINPWEKSKIFTVNQSLIIRRK
jgi:hypothetical protein